MKVFEALLFILQTISFISPFILLFINGATLSMLYSGYRNPKQADVLFWIAALNTTYIVLATYGIYSSPGVEFTTYDWVRLVESPMATTVLWFWKKPKA